MATPSEFEPMLNKAFGLMFLIYALCAVSGYLIFGATTDILVTTNLDVWPGGAIFDVFLVFVVANSFCSVAPIIQVSGSVCAALLWDLRLSCVKNTYRTRTRYTMHGRCGKPCVTGGALRSNLAASFLTMPRPHRPIEQSGLGTVRNATGQTD